MFNQYFQRYEFELLSQKRIDNIRKTALTGLKNKFVSFLSPIRYDGRAIVLDLLRPFWYCFYLYLLAIYQTHNGQNVTRFPSRHVSL